MAEDAPECDHDWSLETDWDGDPNVINGTRSWKVFRCHKCGDERGATYEEIRDYEDARYGR
jgi:hypothetical protein